VQSSAQLPINPNFSIAAAMVPAIAGSAKIAAAQTYTAIRITISG
jgi:hypothetical protein